MEKLFRLLFMSLYLFPAFSSAYAAKTIQCGQYLLPVEPLNPANGEMNYETHGNPANPPVVLIHGLGGDLHSWDNMVGVLQKRFYVLTYDQRGHGQTVARGDNYSTLTFAKDLKALLDYLHLDRVNIIGHSMGVRTAVRFAQMYPDNTISVVLEDMDLLPRADDAQRFHDRYLIMARELKHALATRHWRHLADYRRFLEPYFPWSIDQVAGEEHVYWDHDGFVHTRDLNLPAYLLSSVQPLAERMNQALGETKAPTLFLRAEPGVGFSAMSDDGVAAIQAQRPDAEVRVIEGADHGIHWNEPQRFLDALSNFYRKNGIL